MFSKACTEARKWTRPMIVSVRHVDGSVEADVATFFFINKDGWALTAGHVFDTLKQFQNDQLKLKEAAEMNAKNPGCVTLDPKWITNHSVWYGNDATRPEQIHVYRQIDVALVKLNNFGPIESTPVFRDPRTIIPGTSLCRMGFPFSKVKNEFIAEKNAFKIAEGTFPLPLFPNDGIHTRNVLTGKTPDGLECLFIETSTPGLKGQSGGPVFDPAGRVCGVQSCTVHLDLDFHPVAKVKDQSVIENQFLNLGLAVHGKVIIDILRKHGIRFEMDTASDSEVIPEVPVSKGHNGPDVFEGNEGDKYIIN